MKHLSMAAAETRKNNPSKKSSGSTLFADATDKWEDTFVRNLVRQALKKGSFVSICYPYKFAYCLVELGYIPKSIAEYASVDNKRLLKVPSIREYMNFMKDNEGDWLWKRGEITFCATYVLYAVVEECMREFLMKNSKPKKSLREEYLECFYVASKSVFVAVVVTHPFTILSYRQIGQYVGKEEIYSTTTGFFAVFTKPGIISFLGGILVKYILVLIPTVCGEFAGRTWHNWLEAPQIRMTVKRIKHHLTTHDGRISCIPRPKKFLEATGKDTNLEWLRPTLRWCMDASVYYWVAVALYPLEIVFTASCVRDSGIIVGSEAFVPPGNFFERVVTMWRDGKLSRISWFYKSRFIPNMDAFVVL